MSDNPQGKIMIGEDAEAPHAFAAPSTTKSDKQQLQRMIRNIRSHLEEYMSLEDSPNSVTFLNKNRRAGRYIFYDVEKLRKCNNLFIVVFYGGRRTDLEEVTDDLFKTDWAISTGMLGTDKLLCYASQELADGNWFNVVLFKQEPDKHHVKSDPKHKYAAYDLAPQRFEWVRLHNAWLPGNIMEHHHVIMKSTKYYQFASHWFAERTYPMPEHFKEPTPEATPSPA